MNFKNLTKRLFLIILISLFTQCSCADCDEYEEDVIGSPPETSNPPETNNPPTNSNGNLTASKKDVETFELITITTTSNVNGTYFGEIGEVQVALFKTADKTLSFFIPNISSGEQKLIFELGEINFNVTQAPDVEADVTFEDLNSKLYQTLENTENLSEEELTQINKFQEEIKLLYEGLDNNQKLQAVHFYNKNQEEYEKFSSLIFDKLDASTSHRSQSNCNNTNALEFYNCTAANLTLALNESIKIGDKTKNLLNFIERITEGTTLNTSPEGPKSWRTNASGFTIAFGTALYMHHLYSLPAKLVLKQANYTFLSTPWILNEDIFENVPTEYYSSQTTHLNLNTNFRTLRVSDNNLSPNIKNLIELISDLQDMQLPFSSWLNPIYSFFENSEEFILESSEISITNYTGGGSIDLLFFDGQKVNFRTEYQVIDYPFSFDIKIEKNGFIRSYDVSNAVLKNECELGISSQAPVITNIEITCRPNMEYFSFLVEFEATDPGILMYQASTYCTGNDETDSEFCFPVKLFYLPSDGNWYYAISHIANMELVSGDVNKGVLRLDTGYAYCDNPASAKEDFKSRYGFKKAKISLMNKCGQVGFKEIEL